MDTSYLAQQVTTIIGQLHGLFDEIGVPNHERDTREAELFSALSETLHNQLKLVTSEKHEMTEEAHRLIKTIKQIESSLDGSCKRDSYNPEDSDLQVTYPLTTCLQTLKEKHRSVSKVHRERFEQIKKLAKALESYASHLEPSFLKIRLPPTSPNAEVPPTFDVSSNYVSALDEEFSRVYEEYSRRVAVVQATSEEIIKLWAELGTPQAQTDNSIVEFWKDSPEQLGLHKDDLNTLRAKKEKLVEEKRGREKRLRDLRANIESLWDRLGVDEADRKGFLASNRGCGLRAINEYEDELARLNELKRQNLHIFVEDARDKIQQLWDSLYFSEEEMLDFTPAFSDIYSDALLSAHESEIERLEALKEQRAPTLALVDKHRSLIKEREELNASSQDASRLMARGQKGEKRDPGKLLREEKMRKRITKELPKVEEQLMRALEQWEDEYGRPFLVHGERYLDELNASAAANTRVPPSRSKTPGVSQPPRPMLHKHSKSASSLASSTTSSRPDSKMETISRAGSVRNSQVPPSRMKTPVSDFSKSTASYSTASISRGHNPFASSVSSNTIRGGSPTKLPTRAPLKNLQQGHNSEQRSDATIRGRSTMGPPRAPPPKIKDYFNPTPEPKSYGVENERSSSVVRSTPVEDVYDERSYLSFVRPPSVRGDYTHAPPVRDSSRQTSDSDSVANTVQSGSENWETYDSNSEPEYDAGEMYYAKPRLSRQRESTPDRGYGSPYGTLTRKMGSLRAVGSPDSTVYESDGPVRRMHGSVSEAGWTDDGDAF